MWKKAYFDTRAKIEASGREARWEFDQKRLFERTDYMASICQDLCDILQVGRLAQLFSVAHAAGWGGDLPDGKKFGSLTAHLPCKGEGRRQGLEDGSS